MTPDTRETILFLHPSADRYGVDVALATLVRGLDRRRWRAVVALPGPGPLVAVLEEAGATVELGPLGTLDRRTLRSPLRLAGFLLGVPRAIAFVRRLVRRHAPAIVHTNTALVVGGALGARLARAKHLWHLHDIIEHPAWAARGFARLAARLADVVVSNSHATRHAFDVHSSTLAARHRVVLNGVDRARLQPQRHERSAARAALDVPADAPLVVLVGRVNSWKGQRLFIEAAARLRFRHPDAQFLIVGDPPPGHGRLLAELDAVIEAENLAGFVRRLPHDPDVARVYVAADVVVVPSTRPEPFGLVAAEAMACARPVIAAGHGGILEVVEAGATGLFVEPGDVDKLAWAMQVLIEDRTRAREMGRRGEARQRERFSSERMVRDMDRVWSQLVARPFRLPVDEARVLHVLHGEVDPDGVDPVGRVVHGLATAQARRGLAVSVIGLTDGGTVAGAARAYPLERFTASARSRRLDPALVGLLRALPPATVVHFHGRLTRALGAIADSLARRGIPFVVTPHGAYSPAARRRWTAGARLDFMLRERGLLRRARAIQAETTAESAALCALAPQHLVSLVPRGQDPLAAPRLPDAAELRRPLFGTFGPIEAGSVGLETLLDAFARNAAAGHEGTLWIVGEGAGRAALEARAMELGLARRVVFVGADTHAAHLARLAACDVVVHPAATPEGSAAVLDAASLGRPVVVAEGLELAADVRAAGAGFVVRGVDADQLGAALAACELERKDGLLAERGRAASALVARKFAWAVVEGAVQRELYGLDDEAGDPLARDARLPQWEQGERDTRSRRTA